MEDIDPDSYRDIFGLLINTAGLLTSGTIIGFITILLLFIISALISGSEVAFFSLNPAQLNNIRSKASKADPLILKLLERPKRLLATILIANNFVNVAIIILSSYLLRELFIINNNPLLSFLLEVVVITVLILLFGEIMPKIYATQRTENFARFMAAPLLVLVKILYPVSHFLVKSTSIIDKRMAKKSPNISMSDLSEAINITSDKTSPGEETKILKGIVKFADIEVSEVMKSRVDVTAVGSDTPFDELVKVVISSGYSRIPVYQETFDRIVGILYVKDLLPYLDGKKDFQWLDLVHQAFFVPENKKISDLLKEFQERKIHLAVVVDEYGGTSGIVTLEDIIEEIIGEITDEYDMPGDDINYRKTNDNTYVFEGKTSLNDFCKIIGAEYRIFEEVKGEFDTLAGLILELTGEIPDKNTVITYMNFDFKILAADSRRISTIQVTIKE
ncbi:MAG: gliding motility-associated protein GldE [Bacteroidales bacterium]|nr:gliding motility-associated protein GldE [Bacteroidales bacterium]